MSKLNVIDPEKPEKLNSNHVAPHSAVKAEIHEDLGGVKCRKTRAPQRQAIDTVMER